MAAGRPAGIAVVVAAAVLVVVVWQTPDRVPLVWDPLVWDPLVWDTVSTPVAPINLDSLVATPTGFALAGGPGIEGGAMWVTADGEVWDEITLPAAPTRIVPDGANMFVVYGPRSVLRVTRNDGGATLDPLAVPDPVRTGYGSGRPGMVLGSRDIVFHGMNGDLFHASRGFPFELVVHAERWQTGLDVGGGSACSPTVRSGPDIPPVISTPDGFVVYVAGDEPSGVWPLCEPVPWTSGDGGAWKKEATESPFGPGAYVSDVERVGDRYMAVGGFEPDRPAVWVSGDGVEWETADAPGGDEPFELVDVAGSEIGWVVVGRMNLRAGHLAWVSDDATCWVPVPEEVGGRTVAMTDDIVLIGDRTVPGELWRGTPTDPSGPTCPDRAGRR